MDSSHRSPHQKKNKSCPNTTNKRNKHQNASWNQSNRIHFLCQSYFSHHWYKASQNLQADLILAELVLDSSCHKHSLFEFSNQFETMILSRDRKAALALLCIAASSLSGADAFVNKPSLMPRTSASSSAGSRHQGGLVDKGIGSREGRCSNAKEGQSGLSITR